MQDLTPDLCDLYAERIQIADSIFQDFGGQECFHGQVVTVSCFEDNSRVRELVGEPGAGRVIVVDGRGSRRRALLGDMLAEKAANNGWAGLIIHGAVRDAVALSKLALGVKALCAFPLPTIKRGLGEVGNTVDFAGVTIRHGDYVYCDRNGIVVSQEALSLPS
ncbi:putative 4-hydroxy-4-methyl-2-oxoglutarate aldolase [Maribrevibacterium harenarium]|uniref:4-hydroxy-4-methyl-2-oxoglutarate aldolase n=1 Tax=Maribrevibacterium harenarium TaxID=2589817 RepID=A0A501WLA9_9GAMM|nr:putative 4-hydroxy-4-methyl-2-oxoglutarate aldolase [Maribrevibacterium harenarium]TPE49185.1 putative 4-hydroxy-4-methyl-2-oxoglutarate aldolase [Maribrevibacterium harenarium]